MPEVKEPARPQQHVQESLFLDNGESAIAARDEEARKRQLEKEAIIAQQKAEREAQKAAEEAQKVAAEAEKKRKADCEELIQDAARMKNNGEYKSALKKLEKARRMKITEKTEAIDNLEKQIQKEKSEHSFWGNITKKVGEVVEKVLNEDE